MFQAKSPLFIYCVSPVHMGAGTSLGAVDNPIQRERHTEHPMIAGSGLKGALRHGALGRWGKAGNGAKKMVNRIFGPATNASDHAGAISFADAQIVLFPVRSLRQSYVYATCPTALARLQRLLALGGIKEAQDWQIPDVQGDRCVVVETNELMSRDHLVLEVFQFQPEDGKAGALKKIAAWLGKQALPEASACKYFAEKVAKHTVLLSDDRFGYFVKNATIVEPHVRINDETGTADDGGLFYTENLPPESLLVSLAMASRARDRGDALEAAQVLATVAAGQGDYVGFDQELVQIGGDATTGRGQVMLRFAGIAEGR